MIQNYLKIALRNLLRNKVYSFTNIAGLALGIISFLFILEYISFEKNANQFHANLPNLYRVLFENPKSAKRETWESTTSGLAPRFKGQFPEIQNYCRVMEQGGAGGIITLSDKNNTQAIQPFREKNVVYAETSFFDMFTFPLLQGNKNCLKETSSMAISENRAKKYFKDENPMGKTLTMNNQFGKMVYTIKAVYKDFPQTSDLQYDMILSLETLKNPANLNGNGWVEIDGLYNQFITAYYQLKQDTDVKQLAQKMNVEKKKLNPQSLEILHLQPLTQMHLAASMNDYLTTYGNVSFVYLMAAVAILILIIAWFNYVNLSTAGALKRAKEVGIRKVIGADKNQLIGQFLGESLLLNIASFIIAILLVITLQPFFNNLIDKPLSINILYQNSFWIYGVFLLLLGALASGTYTAFVLSSFKPVQTLKGVFAKSVSGILLRKFLVVFQFSISIILIAGTLILYQQLKFMQNTKLGMDVEQVVVLKAPEIGGDSLFKLRNPAFLNQLKAMSFVKQVSNTGSVPGNWYSWNAAGITGLNPQKDDDKKGYNILMTDENYLNTFNIQLLAGQNFTSAICAVEFNDINKIILNEKAAISLGFTDPKTAVGQKIKWGTDREVIGVVKDYHHLGLQKNIDPIVFLPRHNLSYFAIRLNTNEVQSHITTLENLYKKTFQGNTFEYFFADENYNKQYKSEIQYGTIFTVASSLAIFIACLGLFGLAMFSVEQKTKEIGIRKILGASVTNITTLLSKDFLKLVGIAFIIAVPLAWLGMNKWLQDFAYRIEISWWLFALAGLLAMSIALLTIGYQAVKIALANPVKSLRTE